MTDPVDYLFVYGTLRSDSGSPGFRQFIAPHFRLVGRATLPGRLYAVADYPGLLPPQNAGDLVVGEVHAFPGDAARLAEIDAYEECHQESPHPHLYTRRRESVSLEDGSVLQAWVYFYNLPVSEDMLIPSGDFLATR